MSFSRKVKLVVSSFIGSKRNKYDSRHRVLESLARRWSFRIYSKNQMWTHDAEYLGVREGFPKSGLPIHDRKFNLYYLAKAARSVQGDTVECGAFKGEGSFIILKANEGSGKLHHIFDSFEGLSAPEAQDEIRTDRTRAWQEHELSVSEDTVRSNLKEFDNIRCYKGWIPARFKDVESNTFSFVHIDVDLFQPTLDSLEFFYPRMNSGGIIVCDDYGFDTCPGAYKAMNEYFEDRRENVVHLTTGQGVLIKQ